MIFAPTTKLLECDTQIDAMGFTDFQRNWKDFVDGGNGFLYGIPCHARRVIEFNPENKSIKEIGLDLGVEECKYWNGIWASIGSIYCAPCNVTTK